MKIIKGQATDRAAQALAALRKAEEDLAEAQGYMEARHRDVARARNAWKAAAKAVQTKE